MPTKNRPAAQPITTAEAVETLASAALIIEWYETERGPHAPNAWAGDLQRYRRNLHRLCEVIDGGIGAGIVGQTVKAR